MKGTVLRKTSRSGVSTRISTLSLIFFKIWYSEYPGTQIPSDFSKFGVLRVLLYSERERQAAVISRTNQMYSEIQIASDFLKNLVLRVLWYSDSL